MSRRKQLKPHHVQTDNLSLNTNTDDVSPPVVDLCVHICSRCCAEFSAPSDLEQHQTECSPDPPVLIVNDDLLSCSKAFPAASLPASKAGGTGRTVHNTHSQDRSSISGELMGCFSSSRRSAESPGSSSSNQSISGADAVHCMWDFPESLCTKSKVLTENVKVGQFSQLAPSDGRIDIWSLLQQLLALQIHQIHQLELVDQIRQHVLVLASHQAQIPETLMICTKDLTSAKSTNQLKALATYLSQQLAAAARLARSLSTQSATICDFKQFTATQQLNQVDNKGVLPSSKSSQTFSEVMQHRDCGSSDGQLRFLSLTKMSSLVFRNNCFICRTSENLPPPSSCSERAVPDYIPNITAIVEDLDVLATLAQERKGNAPSLSSKESLYKCRFCTNILGSDGALQIHLQSHIRERLYKCGSRFSNLKVHPQRHKERFPHIQINPYLVPGKIQSSAGTPFESSFSSEKGAAAWLDRPPFPTTMISLEHLGSTSLSSLIEKEENLISVPFPITQDICFDSPANIDFRSKENPTKTSDSVETRQQRAMSLKSEDVKPSHNFVSKIMKSEETQGMVVPNPFTHPKSTLFSGFLSLKHSDDPKLQLPSDGADKRVSDPNECVICHRILSCQSALRMHHRTHTGERPYQCELCGRAFTTKGNLKTHQAVHRATVPLRVQHSCPMCDRKFVNAVVLQQHVHMHMEGHLPNEDLTNLKYSVDCNEGFRDKTNVNNRKNPSDDNDGNFSDNQFKSLSIRVTQSNLIDVNEKRSYNGPHGELKWIKTERPNEEYSQTNNHRAADISASKQPLSPNGQASMYYKTATLEEPFQMWLDSTASTLYASGTAPTDLNVFTHTEDSPSFIPNLREKGVLKNTYCDVCGKSFACQSALDIHYRSHTKERPFICTTCNRGFSTKGNLKQHMLTHQMRDFPSHLFEPSNPDQVPNQHGSLLSIGSPAVKTEMAAFLNYSSKNGKDLSGPSHSESPVCTAAPPRRTPKQHHCKTCGKSFSSSSALQIHERTHTGERPFVCAVCGRAFTTKGNLKVHMGTHMWSSTPSRRGCRLSVDRSSVGLRTRPVKLPEPSQKNPAMVDHWNQSPYLFPAGLKMTDVCVVQASFPSGQVRLKDKAPVENTCLNEFQHAEPSC